MYGIEPRYNEPRYNEFLDITNIIWKPKRKIYLDQYNELQCQHATEDKRWTDKTVRGTQREYSSKPLKHSIGECILVFKR